MILLHCDDDYMSIFIFTLIKMTGWRFYGNLICHDDYRDISSFVVAALLWGRISIGGGLLGRPRLAADDQASLLSLVLDVYVVIADANKRGAPRAYNSRPRCHAMMLSAWVLLISNQALTRAMTLAFGDL